MPLFWDISPSETTGTEEAWQGSTGLPKIPGIVLPGPRISQESARAAGEVRASRTTGPRSLVNWTVVFTTPSLLPPGPTPVAVWPGDPSAAWGGDRQPQSSFWGLRLEAEAEPT